MRGPYDPAPRRPLTAGERLGALAFALLLTGLLAGELLSGADPRKLSVLFIVLSWYPLIAIHELGHALVARALGFRVHEIVLGFGPELLRLRVLGAPMTVRLWPAGGYVVPAPRDLRHARIKSAAIYFAGPAAELALVGVMLLVVGPDRLLSVTPDVGMIALQSLAVAAVMGAVMNLFPTRAAGGASDGLGMLLSLGTPDSHFRYRMVRPTLMQAELELVAGRPGAALALLERACAEQPDQLTLRAMRARCLAGVGRFDEAFAELEALRDAPGGCDIDEAERLHAAACVALAQADPDLLGDAETACRAALERMPENDAIAITHGEVLLALGLSQRAFETLQGAFNRCREPQLERRCLSLMARAAEAQGRHAEAAHLRAAMPKV